MNKRKWPDWSDDFIKSGFPASSLLAGTEPIIWEALGRLELADFNDGKQLVVRKALDDIDLGWIATNTTPFRIAIGGLFDAAKKCHEERAEQNSSKKSRAAPGKANSRSIHVHTQTLPEPEHEIVGPVKATTASEDNRHAIWEHLQSYGACVIRNAVPASKLRSLPDIKQDNKTKLSRSMGNGVAGDPPGAYMDLSKPPEWHDALERNIGKLLIGPGAPDELSEANATLERKSILLLYGEGSENWAHQDNNDKTPPVQAMLLLSEPQKDFAGGEFYVARQTQNTDQTITIVRYKIPFESPGDLAIFMAGKDTGWWHGMLPVKKGDTKKPAQEYLRKTIGMLQPAD